MKGFVFNSSSLLLIYDVNDNKLNESSCYETQLKLVDFANVGTSEENFHKIDGNLAKSLKNIKTYLEVLCTTEIHDVNGKF